MTIILDDMLAKKLADSLSEDIHNYLEAEDICPGSSQNNYTEKYVSWRQKIIDIIEANQKC